MQAVRDGEREVRELIAGRERDERAISLATPYYDVVRQKHGESDEETEEASEVAVDYLTQFLPLVTGTRSLNRQEALEVRERSLKVRHKFKCKKKFTQTSHHVFNEAYATFVLHF